MGAKPNSVRALLMSKFCCKPENIAMSFTLNSGARPVIFAPNSIIPAMPYRTSLGNAMGSLICASGKRRCASFVVSWMDRLRSLARM